MFYARVQTVVESQIVAEESGCARSRNQRRKTKVLWSGCDFHLRRLTVNRIAHLNASSVNSHHLVFGFWTRPSQQFELTAILVVNSRFGRLRPVGWSRSFIPTIFLSVVNALVCDTLSNDGGDNGSLYLLPV